MSSKISISINGKLYKKGKSDMNKLVITLLCMTPIVSFAQNPMSLNQEDMEKMMQQMQKAQACMEKIDPNEVQQLEEKQNQFEEDMISLCASGERDAAQKKAMSFAKEVSNSSMIKTMKECSKMMQDMPHVDQDDGFSKYEDFSKYHVCDAEM